MALAFAKTADILVDACRKHRTRNWERQHLFIFCDGAPVHLPSCSSPTYSVSIRVTWVLLHLVRLVAMACDAPLPSGPQLLCSFPLQNRVRLIGDYKIGWTVQE